MGDGLSFRFAVDHKNYKFKFRRCLIYYFSRDWSQSDNILKHSCLEPDIYLDNELSHYFCRNCMWSLQDNPVVLFDFLDEYMATRICDYCENVEVFPDPIFKAVSENEREK